MSTKTNVTNLIQASKTLLDELRKGSSPRRENKLAEHYFENNHGAFRNSDWMGDPSQDQIELRTKEQELSLRILNEILNSKQPPQGAVVKKLDFNMIDEACFAGGLDPQHSANMRYDAKKMEIIKELDETKGEIEKNERAIKQKKEEFKSLEVGRRAIIESQKEKLENTIAEVKNLEKDLQKLREQKNCFASKLKGRPLKEITDCLKIKKDKMEKMNAELQKVGLSENEALARAFGMIGEEDTANLVKVKTLIKEEKELVTLQKELASKLDQRCELKAMTKEEIRAKLLMRVELQQERKILVEEYRELGRKFKSEWELCEKERSLTLEMRELEEKINYVKIERKNLLARQAKVLLDYESKREGLEIYFDEIKKILSESVIKFGEVSTEKHALYQLLKSSALGKRKNEVKRLFESFVEHFRSRFDSLTIMQQLDRIEKEGIWRISPSLDSLKQRWRSEVSCHITTSPQSQDQEINEETSSLTEMFHSKLKEFTDISAETKEILFSGLTVALGFEEQSYLLIREKNELILGKTAQANQHHFSLMGAESEKNKIAAESEKIEKKYELLFIELRKRVQQISQINQNLENLLVQEIGSVFFQYLESQEETFKSLQRTYGKRAIEKIRKEHQTQFSELMRKNQNARLEKMRRHEETKTSIDSAIRKNINDVDIKLNNNLVLICNEIHLLGEDLKAVDAKLDTVKKDQIKVQMQLSEQGDQERSRSQNDDLIEKAASIKRKINVIVEEINQLENEVIETDKQGFEFEQRESQILESILEKKNLMETLAKESTANPLSSCVKEDQTLKSLYTRRYLLQEKHRGLQYKLNGILGERYEGLKHNKIVKKNSISHRNPATEKSAVAPDLEKRSFSISFTNMDSDQISNSTDLTTLSQNKFLIKHSNYSNPLRNEKTPKFSLLSKRNLEQSEKEGKNKVKPREVGPRPFESSVDQASCEIKPKKTYNALTFSSRAKSRSRSFDIGKQSEKSFKDESNDNSMNSSKLLSRSRDNSLNKINLSIDKKRRPRTLFECRAESANSKETRIFGKIKPLLEGCSFYVRFKKDLAQEFDSTLPYLNRSDLNHPSEVGFSLRNGSLHRCLKRLEFKHSLRPTLDLVLKVEEISKLRVHDQAWRGKYCLLGISLINGNRLDMLFDNEETFESWSQGVKELKENSYLLGGLSKKIEAYSV